MTVYENYFGSDDQRAMLRRGRKMADFVGEDSRYSYYGRTVGLVTPDDGDLEQLAALISIQGNASYAALPDAEVPAVCDALRARNLSPMHYAKWEGADDALAQARNVVATFALPDDLTLVWLDANTPDAVVAGLADMALGCGVLPLCGEVLRGLLRPSVCIVAVDHSGKVVSCAASSVFAQTSHPSLGGQAWWGMLATDPSRQGEKLALILGAYAMLEMAARFGVRDFMTGVEPGNAPSEAVCKRMGLAWSGTSIVSCADPKALTSGRMTK